MNQIKTNFNSLPSDRQQLNKSKSLPRRRWRWRFWLPSNNQSFYRDGRISSSRANRARRRSRRSWKEDVHHAQNLLAFFDDYIVHLVLPPNNFFTFHSTNNYTKLMWENCDREFFNFSCLFSNLRRREEKHFLSCCTHLEQTAELLVNFFRIKSTGWSSGSASAL